MSARHHRPGPYHVGPGGEGVRERRLFAPALPEPIDPLPHHHSKYLASVNAGSAIPLGRQWDIDYVCLELTPAALCHFSQYRVLGGQASRHPKSDFPDGLELSPASPFVFGCKALLANP